MPPWLVRIVGRVPGVRWLVFGMVTVSLACAAVAHWLAPDDFPTFGRALWWSSQTVTTVGYGDVTPKTTEGRMIAALLMLAAVAFISLLTASIAAGFLQRMQARRGVEDPLLVAMERIEQRLAALERASELQWEDQRPRSGADG